MPALPQYTYIFALGIVFAFADAFNIGANDVANSFSTSVSSRSLTLRQAALIATFCEFLGALLLGSRVVETVRSQIVHIQEFQHDPPVLMLGMLCALMASSTWLAISTKVGLPTSSTHTIVGSIVGFGVATLGTDGVNWGWTGLGQILASWGISPMIAGIAAAAMFMITKYAVLKRTNSLMAGLRATPVYFAITTGILTMMVVWNGAPSLHLNDLSAGTIAGATLGVMGVTTFLCILFFYPFLYRKLVMSDWKLRWYHIFLGPLLWRRGPVPWCPEEQRIVVQNYYRGHLTRDELDARDASLRLYREATELGETMTPKLPRAVPSVHGPPTPDEHQTSPAPDGTTEPKAPGSPSDSPGISHPTPAMLTPPAFDPSPRPSVSPATPLPESDDGSLVGFFRYAVWPPVKQWILHGVDQDIVHLQQRDSRISRTRRLEKMHARASRYDNQTEHLFSFLQVLTASTQSFAHGFLSFMSLFAARANSRSNDVANAVGPLATIFLVWQTNTIASTVPVPVWILAFGGLAIVIGFATWGYNVMKNLGNRLTLHSPSRGFSMELGSALTVLVASRLGLPVSTAQCIVGATIAVGLCNGDWKAMNWRMALWIFFGWILTVPVCATISGCLMAFIINAPQWKATGI